MHYIYKITNLINNKLYIGQTVNISKRWSQHKTEAKRDDPRMVVNQAMKKHGIENFTFDIIAECETIDDANIIETELIVQYQSHISLGNGYNVSNGGSNAPKTEEWKEHMSKLFTGRPISEETKKKISDALIGRPLSEETKKKMSEVRQNMPAEQRQKISEALEGHPFWGGMTGKHHSEEACKKISESNMGKPKHNEASRKKISDGGKGKKRSQEFKDNLSQLYKNRTWKLVDGKRVWSIKNDE
jgi:group I intron endonuclease